MPETAILNADVSWDEELDDSIGPNYGWERLRRSQLATAKPAFGRAWTRTIGVEGHTTQFSWLKRSRACVERLKRWAEQYEGGFFTVIDYDGGGRHYVGNFVGDMPITQAGNDAYNIQGWTFQEIPGCPMVSYPDAWDLWSITQWPFDDYGDQLTATYAGTPGSWARPAAVVDEDGVWRQPRQLALASATASLGDWVQHEYVGYGCRLWLARGPNAGTVRIELDGAIALDNLSLAAAQDLGPELVYDNAAIPLGVHRVKVTLVPSRVNFSSQAGTDNINMPVEGPPDDPGSGDPGGGGGGPSNPPPSNPPPSNPSPSPSPTPDPPPSSNPTPDPPPSSNPQPDPPPSPSPSPSPNPSPSAPPQSARPLIVWDRLEVMR